MRITKDEFLEIYKGLAICDKVDLFYSKPATEDELYNTYLPSKLWRLNNIYTVVNKAGTRIKFCMNKSQHRAYAASLHHPRVVILKSRQQGISTLWLVSFFDDAITRTDLSIGLMAQGEDETEKLLTRTKLLWDTLHPDYKLHMNIDITKNNSKEFSFTNGSTIFIRTSFRSTALQRLHVSEMGKIANKSPEKATETMTGTLQAIAQGQLAIIESTAEGDNLFKNIWDNAMTYYEARTPKDFYPIFLSWLDDPDCVIEKDQHITDKVAEYFTNIERVVGQKLTQQQKNFWIVQYRELGDKIYQEYPSTALEAFMATKKGSYYAESYMEWVKGYGRERKGLYDKNLDVQLAIDLGWDDTNVISVFQVYGDEFRYIDEYYDNAKKISEYTDWMKTRPWFDNLTHVILPPDGEVHELGTGKTRRTVFEEELRTNKNGELTGILFTTLEKSPVAEGIDNVRQVIGNMWIDPVACEYLVSCFLNYRKMWNVKRSTWEDKPYHDDYSNGADSIRYSVIGAIRGKTIRKKVQQARDNARRLKVSNTGYDV